MNTRSSNDPMPYFRYGVLNNLRDELMLTLTRQKVTLFHCFYLWVPLATLTLGYCWGDHAKSSIKIIIGCVVGLLLGLFIAGKLPQWLLDMLRLFLRKGWFLQPEPCPASPPMTTDDFTARSAALRKESHQQHLLSIALMLFGCLISYRLMEYVERPQLEQYQPPVVIAVLLFLVGSFYFHNQAQLRLVKKHRMQCPTCAREITGVAGMSYLPHEGLCRHCGTKVIHLNRAD